MLQKNMDPTATVRLAPDSVMSPSTHVTATGGQSVTEGVRRPLRDLVRLIDKRPRRPVYTDFKDDMGTGTHVVLPGLAGGCFYEKFRAKARGLGRSCAPTRLTW